MKVRDVIDWLTNPQNPKALDDVDNLELARWIDRLKGFFEEHQPDMSRTDNHKFWPCAGQLISFACSFNG